MHIFGQSSVTSVCRRKIGTSASPFISRLIVVWKTSRSSNLLFWCSLWVGFQKRLESQDGRTRGDSFQARYLAGTILVESLWNRMNNNGNEDVERVFVACLLGRVLVLWPAFLVVYLLGSVTSKVDCSLWPRIVKERLYMTQLSEATHKERQKKHFGAVLWVVKLEGVG